MKGVDGPLEICLGSVLVDSVSPTGKRDRYYFYNGAVTALQEKSSRKSSDVAVRAKRTSSCCTPACNF